MPSSYMPVAYNAFESWGTNFVNLVTSAPTSYGLVAGDVTGLLDSWTEFQANLLASTTPATRTPVTVAATKENYNEIRLTLQQLVKQIQAWTGLTEEKATELGITFRKTTKTPIPTPTETPSLDIERSTSLAITLRSKVLGATNNALPLGSIGYEVYCLLNPTSPPSTPDNFVLLGTATRRFYTQNFDGSAVGKQCYYAVRYVNARQERGPWSNIVGSTVVST